VLRFFQAHIEKNHAHYSGVEHAIWLRGKIAELIGRLQRFEKIWFDVRLFILLLSVRRDLFYPGEPNRLKRCLTYAKGARYYQ